MPYLAEAYRRSGQTDSAIASYERYVNSTSADFAIYTDVHWQPDAFRRLGELYETKGNLPKARKYYESFIELWKDADAELQPQVTAVRNRLRMIGAQDR
jgi:tetratricopeptide (TPR) repeat protein